MNLLRHLLLLTVFAAAVSFSNARSATAGDCCQPCPPPHMVCFCVQDPCTCCTYEVAACVPACCCGQPCLVDCCKGLFGRKTLTYRFDCGHCVDVLVTRNGRVKVRG